MNSDPRKVTVRGVEYWRSAREMARKESELKPISPSVGRDQRLSKYTGDYRAPSLGKIVDEDRIGFAEMQRRKASNEF